MTAPQAPLPCPFCGAEMEILATKHCQHPESDCVEDRIELTGTNAIAAWNRRAAGRASREKVERVASAINETAPRPVSRHDAFVMAIAAVAAAGIEIEEA